MTLTLAKECGVERTSALPDVSARPFAWCRDAVTRLDGVIDATPALAGRLLTVAADVDTADRQAVAAELFLMTFDAGWTPLTRRRTALTLARGRLAARVYVPADARHIGLTLNGSAATPTTLHVRRMVARPGERPLAPGTMCAPCKAYLDDALEQVRTHFLFIDRLPMDEVARELRRDATGAAGIVELDGVLKQLAARMNEAERAAGAPLHSHYLTRAERAAMAAPPPGDAATPRKADAGRAGGDASPCFDARLLEDRVGYVRLHGFFRQDHGRSQACALGLRAALTRMHRQGARRWLVDLRVHTGGNMWPALAGLRPLLGSGDLGYLVDAAGRRQHAWNYAAANASAGAPLFAGTAPGFDAAGETAAVLFGEMTTSSGEMLAIAFRGRDRTRSFGAPTHGATTSIHSAPDAHGNTLGIAWTYVADRDGRTVYPRVSPDVTVASSGDGDRALDAALAWLATQP